MRLLTEDPPLVERLVADYRTAGLEPREVAMLDFALQVTERSHECTREDVEALRAAGWSDEDILDIAQVAAMFNFTNRLANSLGWVPNPEYDSLGR